MRVLLDQDVPHEDVPCYLKQDPVGHKVATVPEETGWAGVRNSVLLELAAAASFEVLLTCDRNRQHQQNVPALGLALIVLAVPDKKPDTIRHYITEILAVLDAAPALETASVVGMWKT